MAALTATNWTMTKQKHILIAGQQKEHHYKAVLASGEIPSGGVPGPARADYGLVKYLDHVVIVDQDDGNDYFWKYDQANNKFRVRGRLNLSSGVSVATGAGLELNLASGGAAIGVTGSSVTLSGNTAELGTGVTIASQTMYLKAYGW